MITLEMNIEFFMAAQGEFFMHFDLYAIEAIESEGYEFNCYCMGGEL